MSIKKILTNAIWVGIIPKLSTLLTVILLPFITPFLTAVDYGIVGIVSSYTSLLYAVFTLGLNVHLNNSFFELGNRFRLVWNRIYFLIILSGIGCSIIIGIIFLILLDNISITNRLLIIALSSSQFIFGSHLLFVNHLYPLRGTFKKMVIPILFANIIGILVSYFLITKLKLGYIGLLSNSGISTFLTFLFFSRSLWHDERIRPVMKMKFKRLKNLFLISLPVIPHTLGFMLMASSDRLVMQYYKISITEIGLYANGYSIGDYISILTTAIIITLAPVIQKHYQQKSYSKIRELYFFSQVITVCIVFIGSIWMREVYMILIKNNELQKSSIIASTITFSSILYPFYYLLSVITFSDKKTLNILWLILAPGILSVLLNLVFIPLYGYKAAMYVTLFSYWSILLVPILIPYYRNIFMLFFKNYRILLYSIFSILFLFSCSRVLFDLHWGIKAAVTVLIALALCTYLINLNRKQKLNILT